MIARLTTDSDHNYIKENQFQENLFLLLKFLNLYYTCLKAYLHESFYYLLVMLGDRIAPRSDSEALRRNRPAGIPTFWISALVTATLNSVNLWENHC